MTQQAGQDLFSHLQPLLFGPPGQSSEQIQNQYTQLRWRIKTACGFIPAWAALLSARAGLLGFAVYEASGCRGTLGTGLHWFCGLSDVVDVQAECLEVGGGGGRCVGDHSFQGGERADVPEGDGSELGLVGGQDGAGR